MKFTFAMKKTLVETIEAANYDEALAKLIELDDDGALSGDWYRAEMSPELLCEE